MNSAAGTKSGRIFGVHWPWAFASLMPTSGSTPDGPTMVYEVEVRSTIYVNAELGGEASARRLVRDHICNGRLLAPTEGIARDAGHYLVKCLSAEIGEAWIFGGNRNVNVTEEAAIEEDIF